MTYIMVFFVGTVVLIILSSLRPINKLYYDFKSQPFFLLFIIPFIIMTGWPADVDSAVHAGEKLGGIRIFKITYFCSLFVYLMFLILSRGYRKPKSTVMFIFACYSFYALCSTLYSTSPFQTLWKSFEIIVVFLFMLQLKYLLNNSYVKASEITNAIFYLAFSLCVYSIIGGVLVPSLAWEGFAIGIIDDVSPSMRGVVPMVHPNMLGQLGGIVALVGVIRIILLPKQLYMGSWVIPLVGMVTMLLAYSRTSMLTFLILCLFLVVVLRIASLLVIIISGIIPIVIVFIDLIFSYLARGQDFFLFISMTGRIYMWEAALDEWRDSPIFGHGYFIGIKSVFFEQMNRFLATADSLYIETLVNLGVIGLFLISSFSIAIVWLSLKVLLLSRKHSNELLVIAVTLFAFVSFIVIRSFTASSYQSLHHNLIYLLISAISLQTLSDYLLNFKNTKSNSEKFIK